MRKLFALATIAFLAISAPVVAQQGPDFDKIRASATYQYLKTKYPSLTDNDILLLAPMNEHRGGDVTYTSPETNCKLNMSEKYPTLTVKDIDLLAGTTCYGDGQAPS